MSRLEKLKRMQTASFSDEDAVVDSLRTFIQKDDVWKIDQHGGLQNRVLGDVCFKLLINKQYLTYSIECQVADRKTCYSNFSYSKSKVDKYSGVDYNNSWVLLGCFEKRGVSDKMIYVITHAKYFHEFLLSASNNKHSGVELINNKYYIIKPESLAHLKCTFFTDSVHWAVSELINFICSETDFEMNVMSMQ